MDSDHVSLRELQAGDYPHLETLGLVCVVSVRDFGEWMEVDWRDLGPSGWPVIHGTWSARYDEVRTVRIFDIGD